MHMLHRYGKSRNLKIHMTKDKLPEIKSLSFQEFETFRVVWGVLN